MRHRTADLEPTTFGGRYTLTRRLAVGGMAEIYLAKQAAMAGFEKEVVIKRLRAELADDPRIVEMFLDEARIGALLNHPNIVHVYDVDEHDGIPYIAMEYIIGEELNELCRRGIQHGRFLPIEHAVELMRQAAAGMGYFHAKRGVEGSASGGEPLEIVHLDISPSNLLVTQDGFLKIIDFGIARARGQHNRGDVIPGKLSYMSPEQAARGEIDHRSDVFSLGIVLYEITVGKRLFRGQAQEVVKKLQEGQIEPPTFARRSFPPALESIVMRALERHPADRYQTAYDLADDLESFLRDDRLHSGPVRIARYLDMLTLAAGGQRRPELVSEAEARRDGEDLDFDKHFDGYPPPEGAPSPDQAREWEDNDQPEGEIAAALGMELAELRALRTPVPLRPGAEAEPITGSVPLVDLGDLDDDSAGGEKDFDDDMATVAGMPPIDPAIFPPLGPTPVQVDSAADGRGGSIGDRGPSVDSAAEGRGSSSGDTGGSIGDRGTPGDSAAEGRGGSIDEVTKPERGFAPAARDGSPAGEPRAAAPPKGGADGSTPRRRAGDSGARSDLGSVAPVPHVEPPRYPTVGSAYLRRSGASRLPWFVVSALLVAVLTLLAYIVWK